MEKDRRQAVFFCDLFRAGNGIERYAEKPSLGAKLAKRAQWAKQRARFGAAVKIFKANAAEYFGHRKSIGVSAGDERGIAKNPEG